MAISQDEAEKTSELAHLVAAYTRQAIGPNGTVMKVSAEDAGIVRATFVSKFTEAVMMILDL